MKLLQLLVSAALVVTITTAFRQPVQADPPSGQGFVPVFFDEFNANSVNHNDWNDGYPSSWGNNGCWVSNQNGLTTMEPQQEIVANGYLDLQAVNQVDSNLSTYLNWKGRYWNNIYNRWVDQSEIAYTSGAVNTQSKHTWKYGYFEGSFIIPWEHSSWPAFWMVTDSGWPPELDIFEFHGVFNSSGYVENYTYHYTSNGSNTSWGGTASPGDAHAGWHTYGVDWEPSYLTYYIDGKQIAKFSNSTAISQMDNMYLILDNQVGGWASSPASGDYGTNWGADFQCDYIHVWQKGVSGPSNGTYRLTPQNQQSMALDVVNWNQSAGASVDIWTYGGGENQRWGIQRQSDGTYMITPYPDYNLNLRLEVKNSGTSNGTVVQTNTYNSKSMAQRWYFLSAGNGWYRIIPAVASTKALDITGGTSAGQGSAMELWDFWGGSNQLWRLDTP